jgi:hypothetical protein
MLLMTGIVKNVIIRILPGGISVIVVRRKRVMLVD